MMATLVTHSTIVNKAPSGLAPITVSPRGGGPLPVADLCIGFNDCWSVLLVVKDASGHQLYTLKTADQTYRVFIEKMNEGAVTLNRDGIILYCNSKFASIVKLPLSRVIGMPLHSFIAPEYRDVYSDLFKKGWVEDGKTQVCSISGENHFLYQLSVAMLDLDGGFSLNVILTDLTLQKEIQKLLKQNNERLEEINAELEASNNDLQQFASVASHDLQEPLRKILIFSTLLRDKHVHELTDDASLFLDKIISSSNRMKTMIYDILSYSRLAKNDDKYKITDLKEVIQDVLEDFELVINEKNAEVVVNDLPKIEVNPGQIRQVFQNLISNALKFSRADKSPVIEISGQIANDPSECTLSDTDKGPCCTITITDNGIGFNELCTTRKYFHCFKDSIQRINTKDQVLVWPSQRKSSISIAVKLLHSVGKAMAQNSLLLYH